MEPREEFAADGCTVRDRTVWESCRFKSDAFKLVGDATGCWGQDGGLYL